MTTRIGSIARRHFNDNPRLKLSKPYVSEQVRTLQETNLIEVSYEGGKRARILIAEKKAILAKTSVLIRNSRKEAALIADKGRIVPVLSQFSDECKQAIKKGTQIRLLFEGDSPDGLLIGKVKKLIDGASIHVKFYREPLNYFIMSDDKEALITTSKESGLGASSSLWTNNSNLIGVLRTGFESDWEKAEN